MSKYSKFTFTNPKYHKNEGQLYDSDAYLNEADGEGEEEQQTQSSDSSKTEDQLRIEACKLSTKISKLMNNVSPADMLEIADACLKYIKYQKAGEEYDPTFGLEDAASSSDDEDNDEDENSEALEDEDFELDDDSEDTSEDGDLNFDDLDFDDVESDDEKEDKDSENESDNTEIVPDEFII